MTDNLQAIVWEYRGREARQIGVPPIHIEAIRQLDETVLYAIRQGGWCLSIDGKWEAEPMPSSRTNAYLGRFRFGSFGGALSVLHQYDPSGIGRFAKPDSA